MILARHRLTGKRGLTVQAALMALGLPGGTRWPEAAERIKALLITARRDEDEESQRLLSELKTYLRERLLTTCQSCGQAASPQALYCRSCVGPSERTRRTPEERALIALEKKRLEEIRAKTRIGMSPAYTTVVYDR